MICRNTRRWDRSVQIDANEDIIDFCASGEMCRSLGDDVGRTSSPSSVVARTKLLRPCRANKTSLVASCSLMNSLQRGLTGEV